MHQCEEYPIVAATNVLFESLAERKDVSYVECDGGKDPELLFTYKGQTYFVKLIPIMEKT